MGTSGGAIRSQASNADRHRDIDALRSIAKRKAGLEVEEARWLRAAEQHRIWRKLGFSTALEYLEDVFDYAPRTAKDRLRVANALAELPALERELQSGALSYSAARELTRVMTPETEAQWLAHARGRSAHDIESLVAGHKRGDSPDDPKDPALMLRAVVFKLDPRRDALLQQARAMFEAERGAHLDEGELMEALCLCALAGAAAAPRAVCPAGGSEAAVDGAAAETVSRAKAPRPIHQVVIRTCEDCKRAWQQARGAEHELPHSDSELGACDAELVREADVIAAQEAGARRPRPTLSIPKPTRDLVWTRDRGRCRFPSCRATRNLAVHHLVHRAHGGGHEPSNLLLLCDGHHKLLHDGIVAVEGRAPDQLVFTRDGARLVDSRSAHELESAAALLRATKARASTRFDNAVTREHAKQALLAVGFKPRAAKQALDDACAHVGTDADVPTLVKTVLAQTRAARADGDTRPGNASDNNVDLAKRALVQLGFSAAITTSAVAAAAAHVGTDVELATLIAEALRRCRMT